MNDPVLVTVNNEILTRSEAEDLSRHIIQSQGIPPQMVDQYLQQAGDQLEKQAVEHFINQTLMRTEAERRAEPVTDEEIDEALSQLKQALPENITLEQAVEAQGATMEDLRRNITLNERIRKLYESVTADVGPVSDKEISAFYEANKDKFRNEESVSARHILVRCGKDDDEAAHEKAQTEAEGIRKELVEGADFAQTAKDKSACPSKNEGGDLGNIQRGRTVPEFERAVFTQPLDEIGPVVKTPFGYHIIQVTEKQEPGQIPEDEVSGHIREILERRAKDQRFGQFLHALRESATIQYGRPTGGIIIP